MAHLERVVVLVDMDCFYCQVEEKLNPSIKGKPIAVVQYNGWRGGGIIAVNYPARERGVTRHMRGEEAQQKCPDIVLCKVPCVRGKADLTKYREAGKDVALVLQKFSDILQRASIDEAYLDITKSVNRRIEELEQEITIEDIPSTYIYGCDKNDFLHDIYMNSTDNEANLKLIVGAIIVEQIRAAVYKETDYECSAGIAHNKILAKLACGFNKPNKQTVLPHVNVPALYQQLPIKKIKNLGGKFGETLSEDLNITYMSELEKFSEKTLQEKYDTKNGSWLYNIARGIDMELVTTRICPKSIGCCKRFPGVNSLNTPQDVEHWISELAQEVSDRLHQDMSEYNRRASHMIVHYTLKLDKKEGITSSKTRSLVSYEHSKISSDAFEVVHKANSLNNNQYVYKVTYLGISAGKFVEITQNIKQFFNKPSKKENNVASMNTITNDLSDSKNIVGVVETNINHFFNKPLKEENNMSTTNTITDTSESNHTVETGYSEEVLEPIITKEEKTSSFFTHVLRNKMADEANMIKGLPNKTDILENDSSNNEAIIEPMAEVQTLPSPNIKTSEICPDCNKSIPLNEFTSHIDYHVALKIATEYNNSNSNEVNKSTSNNANNSNKTSVVASQNINNFFPKSPVKNFDNAEDRNYEICDQCKQKIALDQFLDHLDYHAAKKLHSELNGMHQNELVKINTSDINKKHKLKRSGGNIKKSSDNKKLKKISSFFKALP